MDGVGGIIISPTRELATQIFGELKKAGRHHPFSGGLLIGGRAGSVEKERERVQSLNILVCTPGRLLQHMDETPNFDASNLQMLVLDEADPILDLALGMLVLDEADRILDLGFAAALNAIIANLPPPPHRQTLLFSATQTKSVRDLARLSLSSPEYLSVHAEAKEATPLRLQQTVMVVEASQKLDVLWSFLRNHLQKKTVVFLSSCKQVRGRMGESSRIQVKFVFEAFRRLRPGIALKLLHGRMKQMTRLASFYDFCEADHAVLFATDIAARGLDFPAVDWVVQMTRLASFYDFCEADHAVLFATDIAARGLDFPAVDWVVQMTRLASFYDFCEADHAVLFATDIAARGLDFPAVDWVVQADCPDDVATYIHRVGRTARFNASGRSLLLLTPSEKAMLPLLEAAKIPFSLTKANPAKMQPKAQALAALLSKDSEIKYLAQRSLVTYLRSIHVQDSEIKYLAQRSLVTYLRSVHLQRSLVTYLRSVHLQSNKEVFELTKLPVEEIAASMGLPNPPKLRFLKKTKGAGEKSGDAQGKAEGAKGKGEGGKGSVGEWKGQKIRFGDDESDGSEEGSDGEGGGESDDEIEGGSERGSEREEDTDEEKEREEGEEGEEEEEEEEEEERREGRKEEKKKKTKLERLFGRTNRGVLSASYDKLRATEEDDEGEEGAAEEEGEGEEDELLRVKRVNHLLDGEEGEEGEEGGKEGRSGAATAAEEKRILKRLKSRPSIPPLPLLPPPHPHSFLARSTLTLSRKQRKKLLSGPGRHGGTRLVFDDEGNPLPPLAALALERDKDRGAAAEGEDGTGKRAAGEDDELAAAARAAEERFRQLREEMQQKDLEDRAAEKERLRMKKLKEKLKDSEEEEEEEEEGDEEEEEEDVRRRGKGRSESSGSDYSEGESEEESRFEKGGVQWNESDSMESDSMDEQERENGDDSSEDEGEEVGERKRGGKRRGERAGERRGGEEEEVPEAVPLEWGAQDLAKARKQHKEQHEMRRRRETAAAATAGGGGEKGGKASEVRGASSGGACIC
ncbi:unnamed protein product [Closterium sp. Naga37s-1]|nr:unnamed protein product [Closterium sp. Naga37s-1]